jgi:hypothetical protein
MQPFFFSSNFIEQIKFHCILSLTRVLADTQRVRSPKTHHHVPPSQAQPRAAACLDARRPHPSKTIKPLRKALDCAQPAAAFRLDSLLSGHLFRFPSAH